LHTSPATDSELNESTDQPGATFRRRLFQGEEDSEDELTVCSAQRPRQQQQQHHDYKEVQKQLSQRKPQSFELTQTSTSPPPYNLNSKNEMYPDVPSAPTVTSPEMLQLGKHRQHNAEIK
ncbi:MAG: hypothetical protein ACK55Z_21465, partial [bacterium]